MRRVIFAVAAVGMCVVLGSCAAERAYMGKWEGKTEESRVVMEFLDSDVVLLTIKGETKIGKWVVDSEGDLRIVIDDDGGTGKMLDKERMLITQDKADSVLVLKRAK